MRVFDSECESLIASVIGLLASVSLIVSVREFDCVSVVVMCASLAVSVTV